MRARFCTGKICPVKLVMWQKCSTLVRGVMAPSSNPYRFSPVVGTGKLIFLIVSLSRRARWSHVVNMRESGELALAPASPKAFRFNSRAQLMKGIVRAYPALSGGHYFVRNEHQLAAFDLNKK